MEWYEIAGAVFILIVGAFIGIKAKNFHKNKYHNDSWKNRNK